MPSPERGENPDQPGPPEPPPHREREPQPYLRAARFTDEQPAGRAYFQLQDAMYTGPPNDLSAYRLRLRDVWHVALLGNAPPPALDRQITAILAMGEPTTLPAEIVAALTELRAQAIRRGRWVERHLRPGEPL